MRVYTVDKNRFIYNIIEDINTELLQGLEESIGLDKVKSIVMGGGYGRGEGGILMSSGVPQLYNDLDYFLFWEDGFSPTSQDQNTIKEYSEFLTERHGLDVDVWSAQSNWLDNEPVTMFTYDLVTKSHIIHGDQDFFKNQTRHKDSTNILVNEGERLLYNRLSGILFSLEKLNQKQAREGTSDFIGRNIAKVKLALGDACLTVFGNYHWSCVERNKNLHSLFECWELFHPHIQEQILKFHQEGVDFKLHPVSTPRNKKDWINEIDNLLEIAQPVWQWAQHESLEQRQILNRQGQKNSIIQAIRDRAKNLKYFGISDSINPYNKFGARERLQKCLWDLIQRQRHDWQEFQNNKIEKLLNVLPQKHEGLNLVNRYELLWSRLG